MNFRDVQSTVGNGHNIQYAALPVIVLDANRYVNLWVSWAGGVIAVGIGSVVGQNMYLRYIDPDPTPVKYLTMGSYQTAGNCFVTYCEFSTPVNINFVAIR